MVDRCLLITDFITSREESLLIQLNTKYSGNCRTKLTQPARMIRFGSFQMTEGLVNDHNAIKDGYKSARRSYGEMNDGIDVAVPTNRIPMIINVLSNRLMYIDRDWRPKFPTMTVLNIYNPGQRIGPHIDHVDNGPIIPVLGLQSDSQLIFTCKNQQFIQSIPRRSLVLFAGDLRYNWKHETPAIETPRMSLVFRCLPK